MKVPEAMATTPHNSPTAADLAQRVDALCHHFVRVHTERMAGIPLLNGALSVEAVGFEWAAQTEAGASPVAEGVLITPWFMSLVRLPLAVLPHGNQVGRKAVRQFGCERFDFIGAHDEAVGYHETCALFSPMGGFTSQELARDTALASLALVRPVAEPTLAPPPVPHPAPHAPVAQPVPARRSFMLGGLSRNRGVA